MPFLGFIPPIVAAILLVVGVLGIVFRNKLAMVIAKVNPLFPPKTTLAVLLIVGFLAGGLGGVGLLWAGVTGSVASIGGADQGPAALEGVSAYGTITVTVDNGLSNTTTTEDYLNDEEDFMTIYSADANIEDGEEYSFNATIERSAVAEDASIKVVCTIDDKEISGVTADNLAEKTSGKIDLDYVGASSTGYHLNDNSVRTYVVMAEGTGSDEIQIKFDHEETYHDGMADLDDYVDVECNAEGVPFTLRVYANS